MLEHPSEKEEIMSGKHREKKPGKFDHIDAMSSAARDEYVFSDDVTPDEAEYANWRHNQEAS